jgi:hypothetical protein
VAIVMTARLHVLLASASPMAVVIRRGPSKAICTFGWNRNGDSFQLGQWLRGRIYERRSDLSPDGKHFLYFAMNGRPSSETGGSWTAISRAPYLKALVLWGKGDCWNGGGLFTDRRRYWLNGCHKLLRDSTVVARDAGYRPPPRLGNNECLGVYFPRLLRDGWLLAGRREEKGDALTIFEKPAGKRWTLRKIATATLHHPVGKGCYFDRHELVNRRTDQTLAFPDWEWAEVDGQRLVWAEAGKLCASRLAPDGLAAVRVLRDFNQDVFEPIEAPY